ncbi:hypothetical protein EDC04DRAFT_2615786 [Pisolithus marmoratus]|nr:hypothetical protein EDC04DRAFT_2615786 [Pisolithus marmoratus]
MTTDNELDNYHENVSQLDKYLATPGLLNTLEWRPAKNGHSVFEKTDETHFIGIVVGSVAEYRLNAGTRGNYINSTYGSLPKAKYQFYLTKPIVQAFRADFDRAFDLLNGLQNQVAHTTHKKDMLFEQSGGRMIRFTKSIFHKRSVRVRDSPPPVKRKLNEEEIEMNLEEMDEETKNWTVPEENEQELDAIKPDYRAIPLRVYSGDAFIEPTDVNNVLNGALVEVMFSIHHTFIKKQSGPQDSFQAEIEQVTVIKPRPPDLTRDPRAGRMTIGKRSRHLAKGKETENDGKPTTSYATAGPSKSD